MKSITAYGRSKAFTIAPAFEETSPSKEYSEPSTLFTFRLRQKLDSGDSFPNG
jgi:hypothetical protein